MGHPAHLIVWSVIQQKPRTRWPAHDALRLFIDEDLVFGSHLDFTGAHGSSVDLGYEGVWSESPSAPTA